MTGIARIRNFVFVGHLRRDEAKRMRVNKSLRHTFSFDPGHVARYTLASRAAGFVMSVLFESCRVRAIRRRRPVAIKTNLLGGFAKLRIIAGSVHVVA